MGKVVFRGKQIPFRLSDMSFAPLVAVRKTDFPELFRFGVKFEGNGRLAVLYKRVAENTVSGLMNIF